jgi:dihydrolipoamide dehydrogenase
VIGEGAVGVEMGAVWNRLGSEVVLFDALEDFLFYVDHDVARKALEIFTGQGLDIRLGARVLSTRTKDGKVEVRCQDKKGEHALTFDKAIVAIGRKPRTDELNAEDIGIYIDERGLILVDDACRTNLPHIYAVGDVVHGPMLAHKGAEEGVIAAERIAGGGAVLHHETIPWVIYTSPEVAWVGKTEKELKAASRPFRSGVFPLAASGRARAMNTRDGMVKILADRETDEILGVHILAPNAAEMIAEAVVAMEFAASAEDLARIVHAHPSISEAVHEAALDVEGRARQV